MTSTSFEEVVGLDTNQPLSCHALFQLYFLSCVLISRKNLLFLCSSEKVGFPENETTAVNGNPLDRGVQNNIKRNVYGGKIVKKGCKDAQALSISQQTADCDQRAQSQ
jgi:hypothetical protein